MIIKFLVNQLKSQNLEQKKFKAIKSYEKTLSKKIQCITAINQMKKEKMKKMRMEIKMKKMKKMKKEIKKKETQIKMQIIVTMYLDVEGPRYSVK